MPLPESPRLIKAHSRHAPGPNAAFNIEDIRQQCDAHVARARRQVAALIEQADADADAVRRDAFEQGQREGHQAGLETAHELIESKARERADELLRDQLATLLPAIDRLVEGIEQERERWMTEWESSAIRLSTIIAGKLVRRELSERPELSVNVVREALQVATGIPRIKLTLHPQDLEQLHTHGKDVLERIARLGEATLEPNAAVTPGGCLIETPHGAIDSRIETQLARITDELFAS